MNNIFITSKKLGTLKLDKIIFEAATPVLFTCVNENKKLFLCTHFQSNYEADKWLIKEVTPSIIVSLLKDEITIRNAFLQDKKNRYTFSQVPNGSLCEHENNNLDWDNKTSISLPSEGEFLEADEGEFDDLIYYYQIKALDRTEEILNCFISLRNDLPHEQIKFIDAFNTTLTQNNHVPLELTANSNDNYNDYSIENALIA